MSESVLGVLAEVESAIEGRRLLDAWEIAKGTGVPLYEWPEGEALTLAARLATLLGAPRLSKALHWKNWRRRNDPARFFHALFVRTRFTPLPMLQWEVARFIRENPGMAVDNRADLLAFQAWIHTYLEDFIPAEDLLDEAMRLNPGDPWLRVERSSLLAASDRYEEALEEAQAAVRMSPRSPSAVNRCARALIHLGRDDEALELLLDTHRDCQDGSFVNLLQQIFCELEDHERGLWCLSEYERLCPLLEPGRRKWLASKRADFHLMAGRMDDFLEQADLSGRGYWKQVAENVRREGGRDGARKRLDVPFVRQHRSTCAPATLSAIAAFWGRSHDHLAIADAICYDGTPWHKEKQWAEDNGFLAREFRLTRENLKDLIDRGVPFTLTTRWVTGAHLQACIGYDTRTDTVFLRDPTHRQFGEMLITGLLEDHRVTGPCAMVMVPTGRADLLDGLTLDDESVYDCVHQVRVAIGTHDRSRIETALARLRDVAPDHVLFLEAELRVAQALEDRPRALAAIELMLERVPEDESMWLTRCTLLHQMDRTAGYRAALEEIVRKKGADAVFLSDLGELLAEDARELKMADYYLRRAMSLKGGEARVYENLARCRMKERRFQEASDLWRAASCLSHTFEPYADRYFETTRVTGNISGGIAYLEQRTRQLGAKAHGPWITLARALDSIHRSVEAAAVLEDGVRARPDDGLLALHGGRLMTGWGADFRQRGLDLMRQSRGRVKETLWLKESAETAGFLGERKEAILHWKTLLVLKPADIGVWRPLVRLVAEEDGKAAAIAMLDKGVEEHPDLADLWALAADWLRSTPRGPLPALDRYLELEPRSAWGFRERALRRMDLNDLEGALADAIEGCHLDPMAPSSPNVHGLVLGKLGRREEAAAEFRRSIALSVDDTDAPSELVELAEDREQVLEALSFIEDEMHRQVSDGVVVKDFQRLAWRWMDPPLLLEKLKGFCQDRPDLWQTWSARTDHALRMGVREEALDSAQTMVLNFPLMASAWLDLAKVHEFAGDSAGRAEAALKALDLSPGWGEAARTCADALEDAGEPAEAESVLRQAVSDDPLDRANHGYLADLLWRLGRKREAVEHLREGLRLCPYYGWGWNTVAAWAMSEGLADEIVTDLEATSQQQGHHRSWWPVAADAWDELGRTGEAITAIRKALELSPGNLDLRDRLACLLADDGQIGPALAACGAEGAEDGPPVNLSGRRTSILMQSGQPVQAIKEMRALLEREPDYIWGLGKLTQWLNEREDWKGVRETAARWARQAPRSSTAFGHLGQAHEELSEFAQAEEAFARAFMLKPDYSFAGRRLLNLQMKAGRFAEAAETLRRLQYYVGSVRVAGDAVELELRAGRHADALRLAELMLDDPREDLGSMDRLVRLFKEHGQLAVWTSVLDRRLDQGDVTAPGALAASIANTAPGKKVTGGYGRLKNLPKDSPLRKAAWLVVLEAIPEEKKLKEICRWAVDDREELAEDAELWAETGRALLRTGAYGRGIAWFKDWRDRRGELTADLLLWYGALCDGELRDRPELLKEAAEARREGLRLFPNDPGTPALRASVAFHEALEGNIESAKGILAEFESGQAAVYYQKYVLLPEAIIAAANGDEWKARTRLTEATNRFPAAEGQKPPMILELTYKAVASHLPWAKGKAGKVRNVWRIGTSDTPVMDRLGRFSWIIWAIIVITASSAARTCSSDDLPVRAEDIPRIPRN